MPQKSIYTHEYRTMVEMLRAAREKAGVTQVELARRLKVTQSSVSKIERGELRLDIVQLREWCRALKLPLSVFVREFEKKLQ